MILGISHIVRGSTALAADRRLFEALGWSVSFTERGLPTPAAKRSFMATHSEHQDLVYLHQPRGPALELIHYSDAIPLTQPPLQLVLPPATDPEVLRGAVTTEAIDLGAAGGGSIYSLMIPEIAGALWFARDRREAAALVHFVSDLPRAQEFWATGFGFRPASPGIGAADCVTLTTRSPLPQWRITLTLVRREEICREWLLDGAGIRCLSFLATDSGTDGQALLRAGAEPGTGAMSYTINGQPLEVEMFKGPDGVMVELVSVPRHHSQGVW